MVAGGILTLTTDFGISGPYVAAMKGVVLGLAPLARLVDVSHSIAPQDVAGGSFVLAAVAGYFPAGTVHLAVVDPGVGTDRKLIAVAVDDQFFVLPDNGLIAGVLQGRDPSGTWEIRNPTLRRPVVAPTFHGRDILAPASAHLLLGGDPADLGPPLESLVLPWSPGPREDRAGLTGEVVFLDGFGNLISNIPADRLGAAPPSEWSIEILGRSIAGLIGTYADRPGGTLVGLVGSSGRVEVAVVNGDAARHLGAARGTPLRIVRRPEPLP
jgi:S-adenosylmethionine hydrolase